MRPRCKLFKWLLLAVVVLTIMAIALPGCAQEERAPSEEAAGGVATPQEVVGRATPIKEAVGGVATSEEAAVEETPVVAYQVEKASELHIKLGTLLSTAVDTGIEVANYCDTFWKTWKEGTDEEMLQLAEEHPHMLAKVAQAQAELNSTPAIIAEAKGLRIPAWYRDYFASEEETVNHLSIALEQAEQFLTGVEPMVEMMPEYIPALNEIFKLWEQIFQAVPRAIQAGNYAEAKQKLSPIPATIDALGEGFQRFYSQTGVPILTFFIDRFPPLREAFDLDVQYFEAAQAKDVTRMDQLREQVRAIVKPELEILEKGLQWDESDAWFKERFGSSLEKISSNIEKAVTFGEAGWIPTEAEAGQLFNAQATDAMGDVQEFTKDGGSPVTVSKHGEVDIKSAHTRLIGENVILWLEVAGAINDDCTYQFKIYFDPESYAFDMQVEYRGGKVQLYNAATGEFTDCESQKSDGMLIIMAPKAAIGSPPGWRIEVSAVDAREFSTTGKQYLDDLHLRPAKTATERQSEEAELIAEAQWKPTKAELSQLYNAYGTDDKGDVQQGKLIAGTSCFEPAGVVGGHPEVDLLEAHTRAEGNNVVLWLKVASNIVDNAAVTYKFNIFYSSNFDMSDLTIHYRGGVIYSATTSSYGELKCRHQKSDNTLRVVVPKEVFGSPREWHVIVSTDDSREVVWGKPERPDKEAPYVSGQPYHDFLTLDANGG